MTFRPIIIIKGLIIDLVTVFDAILTSGQTREKLQCLYEGVYINAKFAINSHCSYKKNLAKKSLCIF